MTNTFFETAFGEAKAAYLESITDTFEVEESLFNKLPRLHRVYRMPYFTSRRYFTVLKEQPFLMTGLTQWSKKIISQRREDAFLETWKMNMIKEGNDPDEYAWMASEFGTLVHIIAAHIFSARASGQSFSTIGLDKYLLDYMQNIGISGYHFRTWYDNLCKAIRSLNEFYSKTEMEVLAVEYCVIDFENNICTPLDIICNITVDQVEDVPNKTKEGTKRRSVTSRETWNLNIKARKNSAKNSSDKYQICAEQYLFNKYLKGTEFKVTKTGVLSPMWGWLKKENADCKLHDFTGAFSEEDWNWYINMWKNEPGGVNTDFFNPNLSKKIGDSNVFSVNSYGKVSDMDEMSIGDYILSRFSDK